MTDDRHEVASERTYGVVPHPPKTIPAYALIAAELRRRRQEQGIPLALVADALGVSTNTVRRFESGVTNPRVSFIQQYARAIGHRLAIEVVDQEAT